MGKKELKPINHVKSCMNMLYDMNSHFLSHLCEWKDVSFLPSKNEVHNFLEKDNISTQYLA